MKEIIELIKNNKDIKYEYKEDTLIIYNQNNNKRMEIIKETYNSNNNSFEEFIISFATQHRHFEYDLEEIEDYLNDIMNDQILPIEFFLNNQDRFGGEISKELLANLSIKTLADYFGYNEDYLSNFEYEIHSWSGKYDIKRTPVNSLKE